MTYIKRGTKCFFEDLPKDEQEDIIKTVAARLTKRDGLTEEQAYEAADDLINRNNVRRSRYEWRTWAGVQK